MLEATIRAVHAAGFRLMLCEEGRGWSAIALGDNAAEYPNGGAMYTRAIGFGAEADEAMAALMVNLKKGRAEPTAPPSSVEEDYSDLV